MVEYEEGKSAKFNAGLAFVERVHDLQTAINAAKLNPLAINPSTGTYNYENLTTCADSLISEGWDKFSPDEKKVLERMEAILNKLKKFYPPVRFNSDGSPLLIPQNFEKIMDFFKVFERKIKEIYGTHDLNNPSKGYFNEGY